MRHDSASCTYKKFFQLGGVHRGLWLLLFAAVFFILAAVSKVDSTPRAISFAVALGSLSVAGFFFVFSAVQYFRMLPTFDLKRASKRWGLVLIIAILLFLLFLLVWANREVLITPHIEGGMLFGSWNPISIGCVGLVSGMALGLVWVFFRGWRRRASEDWLQSGVVAFLLGVCAVPVFAVLMVLSAVVSGEEAVSGLLLVSMAFLWTISAICLLCAWLTRKNAGKKPMVTWAVAAGIIGLLILVGLASVEPVENLPPSQKEARVALAIIGWIEFGGMVACIFFLNVLRPKREGGESDSQHNDPRPEGGGSWTSS